MDIDKKLLVDSRNRPLTQSLFLELGYNTDFAVYTLKGWDHCYKGKTYPSLKRLFLEHEDPTEYDFANKYLLDWDHWKRLEGNKMIAPHIIKWRNELELKIRSQAVKDIMDMTADEKSFQAAKWLADRGWEKRGAGRPSNSEKKMDEAVTQAVQDEYDNDVVRLFADE